MDPSKRPLLVLIDGANYAFRAYHGLPRMSNSKGRATHAALGFANLLARYVTDLRPAYLAVTWDPPVPSRRKLKYDAYKAQRKPIDPELLDQLPWFEKLTRAFNIPFLEAPGWEADDVMATLALRFKDRVDVQILSTDKDLMQIVGDGVTLLDSIRNKVYDPAAVVEKWGVPPEKLRDALALQGDTSDNIPGVPGVGEKTAASLVNRYGSLEAMMANPEQVEPPRIRASLMANLELARLSLDLVTLDIDAPVSVELEDLALPTPNVAECQALFTELEFNSLLKRFGQQERKAGLEVRPWDSQSAHILGTGQAPLFMTSVADSNGVHSLALARVEGPIHVWAPAGGATWIETLPELRTLLSGDRQLVGYDLKREFGPLRQWDLPLGCPAGDVLLESYLVSEGRTSHELVDLAAALLSVKLDDKLTSTSESLPLRLAERLDAIRRLHVKLGAGAEKQGSLHVLNDIELPLIPVLAEMEASGIKIDASQLENLSGRLTTELEGILKELRQLSGDMFFNPGSPKQLAKVLFEDLGLRVIKRTKTGPSTDSSVLEELAEEHPLPAKILSYRSLTKLKNTYLDTLPQLIHPQTGRVHTTFNQAVAATGRLSSSDPNLQNIPVRSALGREIRASFVAAPGHVLLSADYSQIELRLMAHLSGDTLLSAAFHEGQDVHTRTASELYGVPIKSVTSELRRAAKAINFGVLYGMGAHRLAGELGIPHKEAQAFIDRYFERFSGVRTYLNQVVSDAHASEYVTTLEGRRRYLPEINSKQFNVRMNAERMATNTPLQGSAADLIKLAMISISHRLKEQGLKTTMLLQVHDELVFEVPLAEVEAASTLIRSEMEGVRHLSVPLVVDIGYGPSWAEAH